MEYNREIINTHSKKQMRIQYNKSEKWMNFAQRSQRNPYVQKYLMEKYNGICQYCGLPIHKDVELQHKTYDKECVSETTVKLSNPTIKRQNRICKVPDCEHCEKFHDCIDDALFPVHAYCNYLISLETYKIVTNN